MPATTSPVPAGFVRVNLVRPNGERSTVNVSEGATLDVLLQQEGYTGENFTARVDRAPASGNTALRDGATVSVAPAKVAGARR